MLRNSLSSNSGNTSNHPVTGLSSDKLSMSFRSRFRSKMTVVGTWGKAADFPWGISLFFLFERGKYNPYFPTLVDFSLFPRRCCVVENLSLLVSFVLFFLLLLLLLSSSSNYRDSEITSVNVKINNLTCMYNFERSLNDHVD